MLIVRASRQNAEFESKERAFKEREADAKAMFEAEKMEMEARLKMLKQTAEQAQEDAAHLRDQLLRANDEERERVKELEVKMETQTNNLKEQHRAQSNEVMMLERGHEISEDSKASLWR